MKKILLIGVLVFITTINYAQVLQPVKWKFELKELKGGHQYEILAHATIQEGFKLYGISFPDGGPIKTTFNFNVTENCKSFGATEKETPSKKSFDKMFEMEITYFKEKATIKQKIWVTKKPARVEGFIEFMSCNDDMCIPPSEEEFSFIIE